MSGQECCTNTLPRSALFGIFWDKMLQLDVDIVLEHSCHESAFFFSGKDNSCTKETTLPRSPFHYHPCVVTREHIYTCIIYKSVCYHKFGLYRKYVKHDCKPQVSIYKLYVSR